MTAQAVPEHTPGDKQCEACGLRYPLLVDDGPLCIRCDRLHYPHLTLQEAPMTTPPLTQLSPARRADILRQLARHKRPRLLLPTLAARAGVLAQEVSDLAAFHGGLDQPQRLLKAADILDGTSAPTPPAAATPPTPHPDIDDFNGRVDEARAAFVDLTPAPNPAPIPEPAPTPDEKACVRCTETKPLSEYPPDTNTRSGRSGVCRTCQNKRPPTETRIVINRARSRASARLVKAHHTEFLRLYEEELAAAKAEHARLTQAAAGHHDAPVARLRPGPKRQDQTDVVERLDVARCQTCSTHHDATHVCPNCGDTTPDETPETPAYLIREWAIEQGLAPIPPRGPLPKRILAAWNEREHHAGGAA